MHANFVTQISALILTISFSFNAKAAQELDYIGSWKFVSMSLLDKDTGNETENVISSKSILMPEKLDLMEIQSNGLVYRTALRYSTNLPSRYLVGYFVMLSKPSGPAVIRMTKPDSISFKRMTPNFDGNYQVSLEANQLTLKTPYETLKFQRITNAEANSLIDSKVKSAALAKTRSEKLFQFVRGKTYEFINNESIGFNEAGEKIEADQLHHEAEDETGDEIEVIYRSAGEKMESEHSGQSQMSDEQYDFVYRKIRIKTIKFDKLNDSGSIDIMINNDTTGVITFQLQSESSLLYAKIFITNSKGKIDPYQAVSVEGAIKLSVHQIEFRQSLRQGPDYKTGRDHIYRFAKTNLKLEPRQAPAADVK